jgi:hypothetical protein
MRNSHKNLLLRNGHLGWRSEIPDTLVEGDHPRIISAKFG